MAAPDALGRQLAIIHEGAIVALTAGGSADALDDARAARGRCSALGGETRRDRLVWPRAIWVRSRGRRFSQRK